LLKGKAPDNLSYKIFRLPPVYFPTKTMLSPSDSSGTDNDDGDNSTHSSTTTTNSATSAKTQQIARHVRRRSQLTSMQAIPVPATTPTTAVAPTTARRSELLHPPTHTTPNNTKIGWLGKVGRLNPTVRLRFFRLDAEHLSYYKNGSAAKPRGKIDLTTCTALRRSLNPTAPELSLEIVTHKFFRGEQSKTPDRTYTLVASSPEDLASWLDALQQHPTVPASVAMNDGDVEEAHSAAPSTTSHLVGFQQEMIGDTPFTSGWMIKLGAIRNNMRRRFFILTDDGELSYYKSELQTRKAIGVIHLETVLAVRDSHRYNLGFEVDTPQRKWILCSLTMNDRNAWIRAILNHVPSTVRVACKEHVLARVARHQGVLGSGLGTGLTGLGAVGGGLGDAGGNTSGTEGTVRVVDVLAQFVPVVKAFDQRVQTLLPVESELMTLHQEMQRAETVLLDTAAEVGQRCLASFHQALWAALERNLFADAKDATASLLATALDDAPSLSAIAALTHVNTIVMDRSLQHQCHQELDGMVLRWITRQFDKEPDAPRPALLLHVGVELCRQLEYAQKHYFPLFDPSLELYTRYLAPVQETLRSKVNELLNKGGGNGGGNGGGDGGGGSSTTDGTNNSTDSTDDVTRGIKMGDGLPLVRFLSHYRASLARVHSHKTSNSSAPPSFEFEALQSALVKRYAATVETLLVEWVSHICINDAGSASATNESSPSSERGEREKEVDKTPLPLRYDFHTGAVSTGATQDLFRCLSEQLHIARTEIPQKYALVVKLVLEAFTQYRHVQLKRVYARGVEQDVSMDRICSVANNLSRCVPLLDTLRDDIDIDLVGMDQDIVEDTLDDLGDAFGLTASSAIRCL
jgi:hypothetical protein